MDTNQPPVTCKQCGGAVWPAEIYRVVQTTDPETGEPGPISGLVHVACWPDWATAHGVE